MDGRQPLESLSPEKLQLFAASLGGLSADEMRKAKLLYIRNAISEFRALEKTFAGFGKLQGCLSIIPFFWPVIAVQKNAMNVQRDLARERIMNAIDVWKDDLQAAGLDVAEIHFDDADDSRPRFTI